MATVGDSTDPQGTRRPNEDPIQVSVRTFKPVIVAERPPKICLPKDILPDNAYGIFSLFFTNEILETIAKNTNKYAVQREARLRRESGRHGKRPKDPWVNTSVAELRAFLGVLIYRSVYPQSQRSSYWTINTAKPIHESLTAISRNRFAELEAAFHLSDPETKTKSDCFDSLEPLNSYLLKTCKALWHPGSDLAINEMMSRFTGRAKEKITIKNKPIPTGIKAWVIADKGYFLHWFWYAKGDGPQGIGRVPKPLSRNKTAAVVPALLKTLPKLSLPKGSHSQYGVTLDNLFTSTKLLTYLSKNGYGARGTARSNAGVFKKLIDKKKVDIKDILPWGTFDRVVVADGDIVQIGWKDTGGYCLFMNNMDCGVDTTMTVRHRPNETATCAKTGRVPFGDLPEKVLPRPTLTYYYNMLMN